MKKRYRTNKSNREDIEIMKMEKLKSTISVIVEKAGVSIEEIENQLVAFLDEKYLNKNLLEEKLVNDGKLKIVLSLYPLTEQQMSNGHCGLYAPSYKCLLWQFARLDPAEKLYFDRIINELLAEEIIYTKMYDGDKEPKLVGLTKKGILYIAENSYSL